MRFLQIGTLAIAFISLTIYLKTVKNLNDVRMKLEESQRELAYVKGTYKTIQESKWPKFYDIIGKLLLKPGGSRVIIDHEKIPGVMRAMIISYKVEHPKQFEALKPGDMV